MIRNYDTIDDGVVRHLAKKIKVGTSGQSRYPYRAIYDVAVPRCVGEGHPHRLTATGSTRQEAVAASVGRERR